MTSHVVGACRDELVFLCSLNVADWWRIVPTVTAGGALLFGAESLMSEATLAFADGDFPKAIEALREVVTKVPNHSPAWILLGTIYEAQGVTHKVRAHSCVCMYVRVCLGRYNCMFMPLF